MNYFGFNIILIITTFCSASLESVSSAEQKWVDVSQSISKRCLQQVEKKFGLVAEGTGWTKQEGLKVPSYSFICYRKMQPEQALELYYKLTSSLETAVRLNLIKKGLNLKDHYRKIPIELDIVFLNPNGRKFYCTPSVAAVSVINDYVSISFKQSDTDTLKTLIKYPLKEFEEKVFGASEDSCTSCPTVHQSFIKPMRYRRCSR